MNSKELKGLGVAAAYLPIFISTVLVVVAVIHLIPTLGIMGAEQLSQLYGIAKLDDNLEILMRHRAFMFGIIGVLLLFAAFKPGLQPVGLSVGLASVLSFLIIVHLHSTPSAAIQRVYMTDLIALVFLILAIISYCWLQRT